MVPVANIFLTPRVPSCPKHVHPVLAPARAGVSVMLRRVRLWMGASANVLMVLGPSTDKAMLITAMLRIRGVAVALVGGLTEALPP